MNIFYFNFCKFRLTRIELELKLIDDVVQEVGCSNTGIVRECLAELKSNDTVIIFYLLSKVV